MGSKESRAPPKNEAAIKAINDQLNVCLRLKLLIRCGTNSIDKVELTIKVEINQWLWFVGIASCSIITGSAIFKKIAEKDVDNTPRITAVATSRVEAE